MKDSAAVITVAFSPDGRWLASGAADNMVSLWEVRSGRQIRVFTGHGGMILTVAFSPDGKWLASSSLDTTARIWEVSTGRQVRVLPQTDYVVPLAFAPGGHLLATACGFRVNAGGCKDTAIKLWDYMTGEAAGSLSGHKIGVHALAFSHDGRLLASGGEDSTVRLWDVFGKRELRSITVATGAYAIAFNPDGSLLAAQENGVVYVLDVASGRELRTLRQPNGNLGIAFSPDGHWLVSTGSHPQLTLWDTRTWIAVRKVFDDEISYNQVAFSPDGRLLAVALADNTVKLFDAASLRCLRNHGKTRIVSRIAGQ
ncbi:MAG TPA: WD40 repeat domain-containing protein [Candidatus Angelobacter sp.]